MYTSIFWIALRQHVKEKTDRENQLENALHETFSSTFDNLKSLSLEAGYTKYIIQ